MTKKALGKGLASLLGGTENTGPVESKKQMPHTKGPIKPEKQNKNKPLSVSDKGGSIGPAMVEISKIKENPYQPRKHFKDSELIELGNSIKANGILQPLVVTKKDDHYELIAGERRLRASKLVGVSHVPVIVRQATDRDRLVMAIIENVQRSDLNCIEEAYGYFKLMDEFHLTQEEVAIRVGKDRSTIANFLRILKLPRKVIEFLQKDLLSFGHAKVLASIKDIDLAEKAGINVVENKFSVRDLENYLKELENDTNFDPKRPTKTKWARESDPKDQYRREIEKRTGLHIKLKTKGNGSGSLIINFGDDDEFDKIYDYLMKK